MTGDAQEESDMTKQPIPTRNHAHQAHDTSKIGGRTTWFFEEFWPVMVWATFYVLMLAIPLTLSGLFPNPFATATTVWPAYGLLIIGYYLIAVLITLIAPSWLGGWLLLVVIYDLIAAEHGQAWYWGDAIAILFLMYVVVGLGVFLISGLEEKKSRL
jgi:hypothetical protein